MVLGSHLKNEKIFLINVWHLLVEVIWNPAEHSLLCHEHFDPTCIVQGNRWTLNWKLDPVPTLYPPEVECPPKRKCVIAAENVLRNKVPLMVKFEELS